MTLNQKDCEDKVSANKYAHFYTGYTHKWQLDQMDMVQHPTNSV